MAAVLVLNTPDDGRLRPKHVEWPCRNKTCTVLHQVGVSFENIFNLPGDKLTINTPILYCIYFSSYSQQKFPNTYVSFFLLRYNNTLQWRICCGKAVYTAFCYYFPFYYIFHKYERHQMIYLTTENVCRCEHCTWNKLTSVQIHRWPSEISRSVTTQDFDKSNDQIIWRCLKWREIRTDVTLKKGNILVYPTLSGIKSYRICWTTYEYVCGVE